MEPTGSIVSRVYMGLNKQTDAGGMQWWRWRLVAFSGFSLLRTSLLVALH